MTPYNEDSSEHRARLFFRGCVGYENKLTRHFADCRALDLSNPTIATSRLDEDERAKFNLGRQGDGTIINESGLCSLHSEAFKGLRHKVHSISLFFGG